MELELVEGKLVQLVPMLDDLSDLCGKALTRETATSVFAQVEEGLTAARVKLWKAQDAARGEMGSNVLTVEETVSRHPLKTVRARKRAGRCHELAQRTLLYTHGDDKETPWKLVQGYWRGDGCEMPFYNAHSWLECGGVVYDAVANVYIPRDEHRLRFGAFGVVEFSRLEMCHAMSAVGYHGLLEDFGPNLLPLENGTSPKPLVKPPLIIGNRIDLTANDWQLLPDAYTEDEEPIYKEAATAAEALNSTFNEAIALGLGERETRHMMLDVMEEYFAVGAGDTEPRYVLGELLIERFGEDVCEASGWDAWRNFAGPEHKADRERWHQELTAQIIAPDTTPNTPVSLRAILARINRKLSPDGRLSVARTYGEKQIGRFLLVERNVITNGFDSIDHLSDYAREIGALADHESIAPIGT